MRRRFFLHVGAPKTGTTYLQDILWASQRELRRQGFRLPLKSIDDHFYLTLALRNQLDPQIDPRAALTVMDRLRKDVRRGSEDLLISHELLAAGTQERVDELMELLADFEVHVVITARDLARQVPAEWQQQVKTRVASPYWGFVNRVVNGRAQHFWSVQAIAGVAARWGRSLPPEQVHIVTVPPPGGSTDLLLERFCDAVGLRPEGLTLRKARANASLGYEQIELLRQVNQALGDRLPNPRDAYSTVVKFWFAEQVLASQPARCKLALPMERWDWAVATNKEMVVRLEQGGYRVHGDLADLVPVLQHAGVMDKPTPKDVTAAGVDAIAAMVTQRHRRAQLPWRTRVLSAMTGRPGA